MLQNLARTAKGEVSNVNFNHGLTMIKNILATACEKKKIVIFHRIIFVLFFVFAVLVRLFLFFSTLSAHNALLI